MDCPAIEPATLFASFVGLALHPSAEFAVGHWLGALNNEIWF
jgi:hypothetical protein